MKLNRTDLIRLIRGLDDPSGEFYSCGYYDCDGDWNWWPSGNECWKKFTDKELMNEYKHNR